MMKKIFIDSTNYCEEARLDTQQLKNLVKSFEPQKNFIYTTNIRQADLITYRACGHLLSKQAESIRDIQKLLKDKKSSAKLIVWGCLVKINPTSLKDIYDGPMIGPEEAWDFFHSLFSISKTKTLDIYANTLNNYHIPKQVVKGQLSQIEKLKTIYTQNFSQRNRIFNFRKERIKKNFWYIKISSGCKNRCTFCTDLLAYKSLKSQPINSIIKQFDQGLSKGYKFFFLSGRDLGSYGYDIGSTLPELLDVIIKRYSQIDYKIYLNKISPNSLINMYPKLDPLLSSGKIVLIGSHIQSGSDRLLKLMGKKFSINKWVKIIKVIQKKYPKITLETSIMVGFPSETDKDFKKTINLLHYILFDGVVIYKYNERPNLPSLRIEKRIPEIIKNKRYNQMRHHVTFCEIKKRFRRTQFRAPYDLNLFIEISLILLRKLARNYVDDQN